MFDSLAGDERKRVMAVLCLASLLGQLSSVPLSLHLANAVSSTPGSGSGDDWMTIVSDLTLSSVFTFFVMLVGFRAGQRVQLGWPILAGFGQTPVDRAVAKRAVLLAMTLGLISVCNALTLDATVGAMLPEATIPSPSPWLLSLASVGAAINEEILCRLGLMTILVWIMTTVTRRQQPGSAVIWTGIVLSSLGFASLHLPQAIALYGKPGIPVLIAVFGGNGIPGILFGWLYWKKGILAAMIAHFTADILVYGLMPLMGF